MNDNVFKAFKIQRTNVMKMRIFIGADRKPLEDFEDMVFVNYYGRPLQTSEIGNILKKIIAYINQAAQDKSDKDGQPSVDRLSQCNGK